MRTTFLSGKLIAIAALSVLCCTVFASAQGEVCTVTDPTGTPLNIRNAPGGRVIGTLRNGTEVYIEELRSDEQGRAWAKVSNPNRRSLGWVFREFVSCRGRQAPGLQKRVDPTSLILAIATKYPGSTRYPYSLVKVGATQYLVRGGKILRSRKASSKVGGLCDNYAAVWMGVSDKQMREQSEGEGSIWKLEGVEWKEVAHTSAGEWECSAVRHLPNSVRRCLGADACF